MALNVDHGTFPQPMWSLQSLEIAIELGYCVEKYRPD